MRSVHNVVIERGWLDLRNTWGFNAATFFDVTIHASLMFPADQVLPYMVRNTCRLPPTFSRLPPGTPLRIGLTHPTSVISAPDLRILAPTLPLAYHMITASPSWGWAYMHTFDTCYSSYYSW